MLVVGCWWGWYYKMASSRQLYTYFHCVNFHDGFYALSLNLDGNACQPNPCVNGSVCTDLPGDYKCHCNAGSTGKNCEEREL